MAAEACRPAWLVRYSPCNTATNILQVCQRWPQVCLFVRRHPSSSYDEVPSSYTEHIESNAKELERLGAVASP